MDILLSLKVFYLDFYLFFRFFYRNTWISARIQITAGNGDGGQNPKLGWEVGSQALQ